MIELLFVRHAEAEHTLDAPRSLALEHPRLTDRGRVQAAGLRTTLAISRADIIVASPTRRTLETAALLNEGVGCVQYASPAVGPRMFPQNPTWEPLVCDRLLPAAAITLQYPSVSLLATDDEELWSEGINTVPLARFERAARFLLDWCERQACSRVVVVSHDGTIHNYRQLLGEPGLTRESFLGDAGYHRCRL